ncbi:uncharacterized protein LOC130439179 isoform X1 [Triplophysa dalaica]|uniref:uncharacterized protein LOC130439178 isoform X1 n=1 Tax=Triplophysa dalaica TaxID=1582913 RepID=UPI0024DF7CC2|nr:uncharacterized protein LOC130439178 isoform X1 [Triplophysa dalaica]XP_056627624.1 uncharacterized protein LOC130439179 isoform X1 [Triplophysa dalaica]
MDEADELCGLLFLWLEKRKQCEEKLLDLAKELEDVHEKSTAFQFVGSATSVIALTTAGVFTVLTGGLAAPLLATTVGTIAGAAVDIASTAIEAIISGSTMKDAKNIMQEDEKIVKNIQKAIENLKKECGVQQNGAHGSSDVDCEMATQIMSAVARRNNVDVPLEFIRTFTRSLLFQNSGGLNATIAAAIPEMLILSVVGLCFQLGITAGAKAVRCCGAKAFAFNGAKAAASSGAKDATKVGFKALGAIGFGISLYSLYSSCEEMINNNQGTKASQALRAAAREIQEARGNLEKPLDAMKKITQKIRKLKNRIKSLRKYSLSMTETGQKIINWIIQSCTNDEVVSWLKTLPHQIQFLNLLTFFVLYLKSLPERLMNNAGGHIDIVIVAHGAITNVPLPASLLTPPNIKDTVLYSPWNCLINSRVASAIAEGWNNTEGRHFYNPNQPVLFEPNPLPDHWNHMQRSFLPVPLIVLTPLQPDEPAWKEFQSLQGHMDRDGRVIIPYLVPIDCVQALRETPFLCSFLHCPTY